MRNRIQNMGLITALLALAACDSTFDTSKLADNEVIAAVSTLPEAFTKTEFGRAFQWPSPPVSVAGKGVPLEASAGKKTTSASLQPPLATPAEPVPAPAVTKTTAPNGITTEVSQAVAAPVIPVTNHADDLPMEKPRVEEKPASAKKEPTLLEKLHDLLVQAKVGETLAVKPDHPNAPTPKLAVLEEYDSATGERCRRYAWFAADTERGVIQTACMVGKEGEWTALRSMSHETLSPLATLPASAITLLQKDSK